MMREHSIKVFNFITRCNVGLNRCISNPHLTPSARPKHLLTAGKNTPQHTRMKTSALLVNQITTVTVISQANYE
jgi:hypothetical protein